MRRIVFRRPWGRTYAYNALPADQSPRRDPDVLPRPLPTSGNNLPTSAPSSRAIVDGRSRGGSRSFLGTSAIDLESGPPPVYIRRQTRAMNAGAVQRGTGPGITGGRGYDPKTDGGSLFIPHQRIPRKPVTLRPFLRTIDVASTIPARGIGAPVK